MMASVCSSNVEFVYCSRRELLCMVQAGVWLDQMHGRTQHHTPLAGAVVGLHQQRSRKHGLVGLCLLQVRNITPVLDSSGLVDVTTQLTCCGGAGDNGDAAVDFVLEASALVDELPPQGDSPANGHISLACWDSAIAQLQSELPSLGTRQQVRHTMLQLFAYMSAFRLLQPVQQLLAAHGCSMAALQPLMLQYQEPPTQQLFALQPQFAARLSEQELAAIQHRLFQAMPLQGAGKLLHILAEAEGLMASVATPEAGILQELDSLLASSQHMPGSQQQPAEPCKPGKHQRQPLQPAAVQHSQQQWQNQQVELQQHQGPAAAAAGSVPLNGNKRPASSIPSVVTGVARSASIQPEAASGTDCRPQPAAKKPRPFMTALVEAAAVSTAAAAAATPYATGSDAWHCTLQNLLPPLPQTSTPAAAAAGGVPPRPMSLNTFPEYAAELVNPVDCKSSKQAKSGAGSALMGPATNVAGAADGAEAATTTNTAQPGRDSPADNRAAAATATVEAVPAAAAADRELELVVKVAAAVKQHQGSGADPKLKAYKLCFKRLGLVERLGGAPENMSAFLQRWPHVFLLQHAPTNATGGVGSMMLGLQPGAAQWLLHTQHCSRLLAEYRAALAAACLKAEAAEERRCVKRGLEQHHRGVDKGLAAKANGPMPPALLPYKQLFGSFEEFLGATQLLADFQIVKPFSHSPCLELVLKQKPRTQHLRQRQGGAAAAGPNGHGRLPLSAHRGPRSTRS